ncbi:MAG: dynamin family protein, partial [Thermodesulfobacteriota bacterium]
MQILTEKYAEIINEAKILLEKLQVLIDKHTEDSLKLKIKSAVENLDNLFLIVFMGEFSTGKSSVINALIGEKILKVGITPTTDRITLIKYGERSEKLEGGVLNIEVPNIKLENTILVDTPGTNVTIEQHKKITEDFIPKSDIIFFTIGAERAVTSSEYDFIKFLKDEWNKNIVFLLNKVDIAKDNDELEELTDYTKNELKRLFGIDPVIIPVSAKLELENNPGSGFNDLNKLIFKILSQEERLRIKLNSSIDLSIHLSLETEKAINHDLSKISADIEKLNDFDSRIRGMKTDIVQNSSQFTERINGRLLEFKNRGIE